MKARGHILIVDDDPGVLMAARVALAPHFAQVETRTTPEGLDTAVMNGEIDAILLDMNFRPGANSGQDGLTWLDCLHRLDPLLSIVMMTAYGGVALAVDSLKRGAADFLLKPWQNERLVATLSAAVALSEARREAEMMRLRGSETAIKAGMMIGNAPSLQPALRQARRVAPTEAALLITGEGGSGRETLAREVHRLSTRAHKPFIAVDISAVPEGLLESELFGHRRGAFAGADTDRAGRMQSADGGTLYIEEIGSLPVHLQGKLLTALEHKEVLPLGASRPVPVNVRLMTSNLPASGGQDTGAERFMRAGILDIALPPLRHRREDIPALLEHFLSLSARRHNLQRRRATAEVLKWMEAYDWPGNIRELRYAAERATLLVGEERLRLEDFPFLFSPEKTTPPESSFNLEEIERETIGRALTHFNGNITLAATALGLTRPALYRRLEKHGF